MAPSGARVEPRANLLLEDSGNHMSHLVIRRATTDDLDTLVALGERTFRDTYRLTTDAAELDAYVASAFAHEHIEAQLQAPGSHFFLARHEGLLVGYVHLRAGSPPACVADPAPIELSRLYLERFAQGRGFGAQLMKFALDEARRRGHRIIWLGVYDANERARLFYRQWGFEDVGTREFEFGGTIYHDPVMSRTLE